MKCHQRIIRETNIEPVPPIELIKANASVRIISRQEAEKVILKYEWLGTMPAATAMAVGLYFGNNLAGVECFCTVKAGGAYTLNKQPAICLARGACVSWSPPWAGSYLVRKALNFLDAERFHYVVAYSDTQAGEVGTIYQAAGWICTGSTMNSYWLDPDGKRFDRCVHRDRAREYKDGKLLPVTKHLEIKEELICQGWQLIRNGATRYRYAEALGRGRIYRERRRYLESISKPFPKRAKCQ